MKESNYCTNMGKTSDYFYRMLLSWTLACVKPLAWGNGCYVEKKKHLKETLLHLSDEEKQAGLSAEKGLREQ